MHITLVSLFPEMARAVTDFGVTRRAVENGLLTLDEYDAGYRLVEAH